MKLKDLIESNNTGLDAIKRAPIVDYDTGVRCIRIGDISNNRPFCDWGYTKVEANNYNKFQLKKGDIIVARTGATIGVSKYIDKDYKSVYNNGLIRIRAKDENNPKYIYYLLQSNNYKNFIKTISMGTSTQPNMQMNDLLNLEVPNFDRSKQDKIVELLGRIDKKIELNNETNNNLYEMCNVLYHQLLDDNESNIEYKTIGEIAKKVITGKTPSTKNKEYWGGNIPFITIPDMHNQVFTINTERYITKEGAKSLIPKNSISVSCIATVGLVSINDKDSQTNQQINSIVIENDYDLYYLFEFLTEQEQYMKSIAGGSTTYNINKNTFENIQVPYLNKELIIEYDKKVRPMFEKIKSNQISNDTLSQLRDTLLPKLMNGGIDLDNIEI